MIAPEDLSALNFGEWSKALERGIASHHAGLIPPFKELTEELKKQRIELADAEKVLAGMTDTALKRGTQNRGNSTVNLFAEEDEIEESKMLWDNLVSDLKQVLGAS